MKPSLQLKLSQHLTLTPQLQQSIRLLQLSTLELNQELEQFIESNPLLERVEPNQEEFVAPEGAPFEGNGQEAAAPAPADEPGEAMEDSGSEDVWNDAAPSAGPRDDND